jgi:hypothetical protein
MWMICETDILEIQPDTIMNSLGMFDRAKGMLMMFSRRGLNFSTTRFIKQLSFDQVRHI